MSKNIKSLTFTRKSAPDVIDAANRIAEAQNRTVHNAIGLLIKDAAEQLKGKK